MSWFVRRRVSEIPDNLGELAHLIGRADRLQVVVVTGRGTEIPIGRAQGWNVVDLTTLLGELDAWPETTHPARGDRVIAGSLVELARATAGLSWIKKPVGSARRSEHRPATREIEQLREAVLAAAQALRDARCECVRCGYRRAAEEILQAPLWAGRPQ